MENQDSFFLNCPLCGNQNHAVIDKLPVSLLRKLYKKQYSIDIKIEDLKDINLYQCANCHLKFYYPSIAGDEDFYDSLQKNNIDYYQSEKEEFIHALEYILPTDKVLEIGCGLGFFSNKIDCDSYVGLEFSSKAVEKAKQLGIKIYNQSIKEHSLINQSKYDVICLFQVLEHITDINIFLKDVLKCLKPGGRLIISVPNEDSFVGYFANNLLNMPPHHLSRWTEKTLSKIPEFFEVKLVTLKRELLADMHLQCYCECLLQNILRNYLGLEAKTLEPLFLRKPVNWLLKQLSKVLEKGLKTLHMRPFGHSVTLVYEKQ
jgi:2-polyprenyl-3-methyl-5-hydroxy-6-metoxy-1,4-benzoquinol methylase